MIDDWREFNSSGISSGNEKISKFELLIWFIYGFIFHQFSLGVGLLEYL